MNQKDPNNVSGLLKMHLREKNLLHAESIQTISEVLVQDMVILSVILFLVTTCEWGKSL